MFNLPGLGRDGRPMLTKDGGRDLLAERRYAYAAAAAADGAWQEAAEMFEQTIERAQDWVAPWAGLGDARARLGQTSCARAAYGEALARDPADRHGVALKLAALGAGPCPPQAPPGYIKALFDEYAPRFDAHLTGALAYTAPQDLASALQDLASALQEQGAHRVAHAIDLGCGTGLAGAAIRDMALRLTGVDLSPNMLEAARGKHIYDRLAASDMLGFLAAEPEASAGLIIAADVFVYAGALDPVLAQCARVLTPQGRVAFTLQRCAQGIEVGDDLRFAHSRDAVAQSLTRCGFDILTLRDHSTRREKGCDVPGLLAVAVRP